MSFTWIAIAQNQIGSDVILKQLGITVPALGQITLTDYCTYSEIIDDEQLKEEINLGKLLISDGINNLNLSESINYVTPTTSYLDISTQIENATTTTGSIFDANKLLKLGGTGLLDGRDIGVDGSTLDSHIANTSNPHSVTATQVGKDTAQWNANKIQNILVDTTDLGDRKTLKYNANTLHLEYKKAIDLGNLLEVSPTGYDADYTSIKAAVDAAVLLGATITNPYIIKVSPGTYTENKITIPAGIIVTTHTGKRVSQVYVIAANPLDDLIVMTGGSVVGLDLSGVSDTSKALIRCETLNSLCSIYSVRVYNCSNGIIIGNGANVIILEFSCNITGANQKITTAIKIDGSLNSTSVFISQALFSVKSALLPLYTDNPINTAVYITGGAKATLMSCAFPIAYKNLNQVSVLVDAGSRVSLLFSYYENSATAIKIGSLGSNTKISIKGSEFRDCVTNFKIDSSTGTILVSGSVDDVKDDIVSGGKLSGNIDNTGDSESYLIGDYRYFYQADKSEIPFEKFFYYKLSSTVLGDVSLTELGGLDIEIGAGKGWIHRSSALNTSNYVTWNTTILTLDPNVISYIILDGSDFILKAVTSQPDFFENILIGICATDLTSILYTHIAYYDNTSPSSQLHEYLLNTRKFIANSGLITSAGSDVFKINVSNGSYYITTKLVQYSGVSDGTFKYYYNNGNSDTGNNTDVDISQYDNIGSLSTMTSGYYRSDTLYLTSDGRLSLIYGNNEYATQNEAKAASKASVFSIIEPSAISLARLIVKEGVGIVEFVDERITDSNGGSGGGLSVSDHGNLTGLLDDDHTQYLLVSGSRSMSGSLNMGTHSITNVNLVDGVDVSAHANRHNPGGLDALTTGVPVAITVGGSPSAGTASSYSLSDHQHTINSGTPVSVGLNNSDGTANTISRSDHVHSHSDIRQLIHFINNGPAESFSGAYRVITGGAFPSAITWYIDNTMVDKLFEIIITRNPNQTPSIIEYKIYDTDGTTVLRTATDTINYSGIFETNRTRVIT